MQTWREAIKPADFPSYAICRTLLRVDRRIAETGDFPSTEAQLDALVPGERLPMVVGDVIAEKYKVEKILGMGSIAVVALGTRKDLTAERVALRMLRKARASEANATTFSSEARHALALKSAHVAKLIEVGANKGLPFVAMELLEGHDVATILERQGVLKPYLAIEYISQACEAIAEAHKSDLLHRDLRPKNLFLTQAKEDGAPLIKVLDFGTARIAYAALLKKNPMYMAPEQLKSPDDIDARADIWAMGAILFELVTGHRAFGGDSISEIVSKITERSPPSLEVYLPNPPPGLATVIHRCLEKDRKKRYATAGALAMALSDLSARPSSAAVPAWNRSIDLHVDPLMTTAAPPESQRSLPPPSSSRGGGGTPLGGIPRKGAAPTFVIPRPPRRGPLLVLGAIAIAGGMLSGALVYRQRARNKSVAPSATTAIATMTSASAIAPIASSAPISSSSDAPSASGSSSAARGQHHHPPRPPKRP